MIYIFIIILYSLWNLEIWLVMHYLHIFLFMESSLDQFHHPHLCPPQSILQVQMRNIDNVLYFVLQHLTLQSEINIGIQILSSPEMNRIGGVMVSILSSADDCGFEPQSGQTKDYKIGICCFSAKHAAFRRKGRLVGSESG